MDIEHWFNYGVPCGILCAFLLALWRVGMWVSAQTVWVKDEVVSPVVKSHLELIETLKEHIPKQTEGIDILISESRMQTDAVEKNAQAVSEEIVILNKRTQMFENIVDAQSKIISSVDSLCKQNQEAKDGDKKV